LCSALSGGALRWSKKNGLLVHCGEIPRGFDWNRLIEDDREERIKDLSGL
jgi:hypothetical protein